MTESVSAAPPLLSIVVPVYNGEQYIEECLRSVTDNLRTLGAEERARVEVVVCDNRSSDRTLTLARAVRVDCSYRIVETPEHFANRTRNWHYGLCCAQGTWMMMLHVDDLLAPGALGPLLHACRQQTGGSAVVIAGRHQSFFQPDKLLRASPMWPLPSLVSGAALRALVLPHHQCIMQFSIMRQSAYHAIGGLDARYELVQDWNLWTRLLDCGDLFYLPRVTGLWRAHAMSERYMRLYAAEHLLHAADMPRLVPHLSADDARYAVDAQIAKAKLWLPDVSLESLLAGVAEADPARAANVATILGRPVPSSKEAQNTHRRLYRRVSLHLVRLRLAGSLRLLRAAARRQRSGPAASARAAAPRPTVDASTVTWAR